MARSTFVLAAVAALTLVGSLYAGDIMFDDLRYGTQNNILPGGCVKPTYDPWGKGGVVIRDTWNEPWKSDPWYQGKKPGYMDTYRWPQEVPRYYQRTDRYSQYDLNDRRYDQYSQYGQHGQYNQYGQHNQYTTYDPYRRPTTYSSNNLYAPQNQWMWNQRSTVGGDRYGNWYYTQPNPSIYMGYDYRTSNGRSYGYYDGTTMRSGVSTPNFGMSIGISNNTYPTYYDPYRFTPTYAPTYRPTYGSGSSFSLGFSFSR